MFLTITDDRSGEVLMQRPVADDETMDCEEAAKQFLKATYDADLAPRNGHIPLGCGDFTVEFAEHPGTAVCWSSRSFFI